MNDEELRHKGLTKLFEEAKRAEALNTKVGIAIEEYQISDASKIRLQQTIDSIEEIDPNRSPRDTSKGDQARACICKWQRVATTPRAISSAKGNNENYRNKNPHSRFVLPISVKSQETLPQYKEIYRKMVEKGNHYSFENLVQASAIRKPDFMFRKLFTGINQAEVQKKLEESEFHFVESGELVEKPKVVFVFSGQGSQWLGMGRELYSKEPEFTNTINRLDKALKPYCDWSLVDQINADERTSRIREVDVFQPMLVAIQVALSELWQSFGVRPDAVVGLDIGQISAAHIAGAIDIDETARIVCSQAKLLKTIVSQKAGAMAAMELSVKEAQEIIAKYPGISLAYNQSPNSTVLSGESHLITAAYDEIDSKGRFCKYLKVDYAAKSSQVDLVLPQLRKELRDLQPKENTIDIYSCFESYKVGGTQMTCDYWANNLRQGVMFANVMEKIIKEEYNVFIEISPHPLVTTSIKECLEVYNRKGIFSPTLSRNRHELESIYDHLAKLYEKGLSVDWNKYYGNPTLRDSSLPTYPCKELSSVFIERRRDGNKLVNSFVNIKESRQLRIAELIVETIALIINSPSETISPSAKFRHLGLDSLMAIQLRNQIERVFKVELPISDIWQYQTTKELTSYIYYLTNEQKRSNAEEVKSNENKEKKTIPVIPLYKIESQ